MPPKSNTLLDNIVVVLDHPKDLVNIAGVVRAMMNMGLSRLRLVRPDEFDTYRITGIAHRSDEVVEAAEHFDTLEDAVADAVFVLGTTARGRTAQRNYVRPREIAPELLERAAEGPVAILYGREDRGLTNRGLDLCQSVAIIPTDPDYSSLNLAQAVLVLAYEIFLASEASDQELPEGKRSTRPASSEEMEHMYDALRDGLERIEFFKARKPAGVMRTLRTLLSRAEPDLREARLVRAVGFEIGNYLDRHRSESPSSGASSGASKTSLGEQEGEGG
ncbi:MAG: RNA methyltransferase [Longimicrobiales bacterium]|nr:RNA methyltransferase [Longimicrobiales bacterium]